MLAAEQRGVLHTEETAGHTLSCEGPLADRCLQYPLGVPLGLEII